VSTSNSLPPPILRSKRGRKSGDAAAQETWVICSPSPGKAEMLSLISPLTRMVHDAVPGLPGNHEVVGQHEGG